MLNAGTLRRAAPERRAGEMVAREDCPRLCEEVTIRACGPTPLSGLRHREVQPKSPTAMEIPPCRVRPRQRVMCLPQPVGLAGDLHAQHTPWARHARLLTFSLHKFGNPCFKLKYEERRRC
jgi:hypothetical protein